LNTGEPPVAVVDGGVDVGMGAFVAAAALCGTPVDGRTGVEVVVDADATGGGADGEVDTDVDWDASGGGADGEVDSDDTGLPVASTDSDCWPAGRGPLPQAATITTRAAVSAPTRIPPRIPGSVLQPGRVVAESRVRTP
jgi:hypothetical protein